MAIGSNYFCSLDDKSKQRYKVKLNNIEGCDPFEMKKEEFSGDTSKCPPVRYPDIVNYFLFSLSPRTKEELKVYIQKFVVLPSVRIKMGQGSKNKIVWRNYLGEWVGQYLMYFLLHFTALYQLGALCLLLQLKSCSTRGATPYPAFLDNTHLLVTGVIVLPSQLSR